MLKFIFTLLIAAAPLFSQAQTIEKTVFVPPLKENASRYFYIPFDVPKNAKSVSINYEYEKKGGANVLDLGIFDARFEAQETNVKGFRGWSGGRRSSIFIAESEATNGYVPGEISSGTWRVILGLYKVAPEGVEVKIKIKINEIDQTARQQLTEEKTIIYDFPKNERIVAPVANGFTWFRGDLHTHTFHSDGNWTIKAIFDYAQAHNLDFVGITEHNTFSHHAEIERRAADYKNLLVLRGEEVTTYGGHFNVWGLPKNELIDFRVTPKDANRLRASIERVHDLKLLASLNHPTALCGGCNWSYGDWNQMDAVEIWNGVWDSQDEAALKLWDAYLQKGNRLTVIGSSDTHSPPVPENKNGAAIGAPTTHVGMKRLTQDDLLSAIKNGRVWVSANAANYNLEFSAHNGSRINIGEAVTYKNNKIRIDCRTKSFPVGATVALISNGAVLLKEKIERAEYVFAKEFDIVNNSYFRVEIRSETGAMLALTNPIYIQKK